MKAVAICSGLSFIRLNKQGTSSTHNDATTKKLRKLKKALRYVRAQPLVAAGEHGEECAQDGSHEDNEDGGDAQGSVVCAAAAGTALCWCAVARE